MSLAKKFAAALAPLALLAVSGCATPFKADVSRFQQLPVPQGQTFSVVAENPSESGLEFDHYASLISDNLSRVGYRPAADPAQADLVVSVDYGIDHGREKLRADHYDPFGYGYGYGGFGPWGPYRRRFVPGFYDPFMFGGYGGFGPSSVESFTVYTSRLHMTISRSADGEHLFEGRALAQSTDNHLTYLIPNLIEAMFTGFPGNSGETVRISVAPERNQG